MPFDRSLSCEHRVLVVLKGKHYDAYGWSAHVARSAATTHLCHEVLSDYTIYVYVFLPRSTGLPFCKRYYKEYRV
jgi:hypothetical protein